MSRMTESELLGFLDEEAQQAFHFNEGEIASDRIKAFRAYMREPYGNEEEGRSAVVASDVFDAVEGMLPDLIEVFTSSDKAVIFEPVGPEDEESAEQVTNACNYVFYKQNNGFLILYTALKDGLLMKTGSVKWYYEKKKTPTFTTYRDVDEMQLAVFLTTNPTAEVLEKTETEPSQEEMQQAQMMGVELPKRYTVKIKTVEEKGCVKVCAIPPDELHVSRRHDSMLLHDCPYVAHVTEKTLTEVREMGYDVTVDQLKAAQNEENTEDHDYREQRRGGRWGWWQDDNELDESMVRGYLRDEYVLVDFDGDGIAERRRIVRLGQLILENKECSHVPIAAWSPYVLTHQFNGLSVADLVEDFQRIHTTLWRQQLDNLYLANNQETVVQTDAQGNPLANIDDLLNRRPGGVIRERVAGAVRPYQERWQGIEAMPMLEQLQVSKENRTGYTRYSQGLDSNSLNKTATGVQMIMNASQKRMKMMARLVAECLMAPMFRGIFKTLTDHGMDKLSYRLNGKFVQYDPQAWRDQYDMTINVGIGTGDVQQQSQFLMQIAQAQAVVAQSPMAGKLISPKQIYNVQARLAENAGFKNPQEFWVDPDTAPPSPPPQPDPKVVLEEKKLQDGQQKTVAEMQLEREKFDKELAFKAAQAERDRQHQKEMKALEIRSNLQNAYVSKSLNSGRQVDMNDEGDLVELPTPTEVLMAQVAEGVNQLAQAMAAPRSLIKDEATGQTVAVQINGQIRPVERGPDGRVVGIQ